MQSQPSERIDWRAVKVWQIQGVFKALTMAIPLVPAVFLVREFSWPLWVPVLLAVVVILYGIVEVALLPRLRWERWRYQVQQEEIDLQRGIWFIKRTLIPMGRVQHVDTRQGILMRRYGLATVIISTAAGAHQIPALREDIAGGLRDSIVRLAQVSDDVL